MSSYAIFGIFIVFLICITTGIAELEENEYEHLNEMEKESQPSLPDEGHCPTDEENKYSKTPKSKCPFAQMSEEPDREQDAKSRCSDNEKVKSTKKLTDEEKVTACCEACKGCNKQRPEFYYDLTSEDYYFDSYAHYGIHEDMLKDVLRTRTYELAILDHTHLFKGKTVLDVGSGVGILSLFAAKAGAARVIGIEASGIAEISKQIIKDNSMGHIITIIKGRVEDVELPDGIEQVDVIISEWMGYCLLFESMLETVIFARDKWLRQGGAMFPDQASLFITAIEDRFYKHSKIIWWQNVYGFNMKAVGKVALAEPNIDVVDKTSVVTSIDKLKTFDLYKVKAEDLKFTVPFQLMARRRDHIQALLVFFSVQFRKCNPPIDLYTGPGSDTHWKQSIFYLEEDISILAFEEITGNFTIKSNQKNRRDMDIQISVSFDGEMKLVHGEYNYKLR